MTKSTRLYADDAEMYRLFEKELFVAVVGDVMDTLGLQHQFLPPVFKPVDDGIEPWLNLRNAAKLLQIAPKTLRLAGEAGDIEAIHPLPNGPWIFARTALTTSAARSITERARQNPRYPTGSHPGQQNLFSSIT